MKKILVFLLLLFLIVGLGLAFAPTEVDKVTLSQIKKSSDPETPDPSPIIRDEVIFENVIYKFALVKDVSPAAVKLDSNLQAKQSASKLYEINQCFVLTSAGFYDEEGNHIGLFIGSTGKLKDYRKNELFNGIFFIDEEGQAGITQSASLKSKLALQTGPMLIKDSQLLTLDLKNDKPARRLVVGLQEDGLLFFAAFYQDESVISGPFLKDMPEIVKDFSQNTGLKIKSAINLDGGSASSFYSPNFSLSEMTPIGGYFCLEAF